MYFIHSYNKDYFKDIDSQEKAYWLGFITADGSVSKNSLAINLGRKDRCLLERFKLVLEASQEIIDHVQKSRVHTFRDGRKYTFPCSEMSRITIYGKEIAENMNRLNVVQNKTKYMKMPIFPEKYARDFIRGVFDGDGTVYKVRRKKGSDAYYVSFSGQKIVLEYINELLSSVLGINKSKLYSGGRGSNGFYITWGGNKIVEKIYRFMYSDESVFSLQRKKDIFIECLARKKRYPTSPWAAKTHRFLNEKNEIIEISNLRQFCIQNPSYSYRAMIHLSKGEQKRHLDFRFCRKE